jgi:hypothetical protein
MATSLQCNYAGLSSAVGSATAAVSANTRVTASLGALATVADIVQFPAAIGNWLVPATRCTVGGVPVILSTSTSLVTQPITPPTVGPMTVTSPDTHAQGT